MKDFIYAIILAFQMNHDYAKSKRLARRHGVDTDTDEEWKLSNEVM